MFIYVHLLVPPKKITFKFTAITFKRFQTKFRLNVVLIVCNQISWRLIEKESKIFIDTNDFTGKLVLFLFESFQNEINKWNMQNVWISEFHTNHVAILGISSIRRKLVRNWRWYEIKTIIGWKKIHSAQ